MLLRSHVDFGKHACCAGLIVHFLTSIIQIFSTGKRASKSLLMQVKEIIDTIPNMTKRITSSNVEELWIKPIGCTKKVQEARCFSYPSSVKASITLP